MYEIPAYLVWGFLESGKSTLIKETLSQDYFNDGEKTMIDRRRHCINACRRR